jgi:hypothetical protein
MENAAGPFLMLGVVLLVIFMIVTMWIVFAKADQPGWAIFIPIYNIYCLTQVAGVSGWWTLAYFVPILNIIAAILIPIKVAERFGKGILFGIGLLFLGVIFYPVLAFSDAEWSPS